jgi:hypothetical protein
MFLYNLLATAINQISEPELRESVVHDVADQLAATENRRSLDATGEDPAPDTGDVSEELVARAETDPVGTQKAVARQTFDHARGEAQRIRDERLQQARRSFNVALVMSVAGIVVILVSLIFVVQGVVTAGVISAGSGAVCEMIGLLLFRLYEQANDRLDAINRDLTRLLNAELATDLVGQISDQRTRDRVIAKAIEALCQDPER